MANGNNLHLKEWLEKKITPVKILASFILMIFLFGINVGVTLNEFTEVKKDVNKNKEDIDSNRKSIIENRMSLEQLDVLNESITNLEKTLQDFKVREYRKEFRER